MNVIALGWPVWCELSSRDWGLPQSRSRAYFILAKKELASQEKLEYVFHIWLQERFLPALKARGRSTVAEVRNYVRNVANALEWELTCPAASKESKHFSWGRATFMVMVPYWQTFGHSTVPAHPYTTPAHTRTGLGVTENGRVLWAKGLWISRSPQNICRGLSGGTKF